MIERRSLSGQTRLDDFVPSYEFSEAHSVQFKGARSQAFAAVKAVTADEVLFYRTLAWIRRFGRRFAEGVLNPSKGVPL
jgi:hypothetical protein